MLKKSSDKKLFKSIKKAIKEETREFLTRLKKAKRTKNWGAFFAWWDEQEQKSKSNL